MLERKPELASRSTFWFWRFVGLSSLFVSGLALAGIYAHRQTYDLKPVAGGRPIEALDVIALQLDMLSIMLTVAGIVLAIVGVFGYQSIRDGALAKAEAVAEEVARATAQRYYSIQNEPRTNNGDKAQHLVDKTNNIVKPVETGDVSTVGATEDSD